MPKVSVIIPTHNRANYLPAAIQSVLEQTFQDFELIVVDDASSDNTAAVVKSFTDSRISFSRLDANRGGSAARNQGILTATADYLAFLDDDDEWAPDKLARQVQILDEASKDVGAVYTGYVMIEPKESRVVGRRVPVKRGDILTDLLEGNCVGTTSTLLMRRVCFDRVGLFDETLPSFQDHDMWIRVAKDFRFECIDQPLIKYHVHDKKIWTNVEGLRKGMDRMLEKYGEHIALRRSLSYAYVLVGVEYIAAGDTRKSRKVFFKAITLHPLEPRHYFNLALSLFGKEFFLKVKQAKDTVLGPLRRKLRIVSEHWSDLHAKS